MQQKRALSYPGADDTKRVSTVPQQQNLHMALLARRHNIHFSYPDNQHILQAPGILPFIGEFDTGTDTNSPELLGVQSSNPGELDYWTYLLDDAFSPLAVSTLSPITSSSSQPSISHEGLQGIESQLNPFDDKAQYKKERRRAQNRNAQRRHRERRELKHCLTRTRVLDLERALATALEREKSTKEENEILRRRLGALEARTSFTKMAESFLSLEPTDYILDIL
ncbi:hypothetical protein CLAIMM_08504 [Cladophialophora immunda]|nr:hypothetical protein CLAIMM_08504 [Cladophialophora immunda]